MPTQNAIRDQNFVTARLAVLNTDTVQGTNKVRIVTQESTGAMRTNDSDTISFTMVAIDPKDDNYVNCMTFTGQDGLVYPWVANSSGEVLVDSI